MEVDSLFKLGKEKMSLQGIDIDLQNFISTLEELGQRGFIIMKDETVEYKKD